VRRTLVPSILAAALALTGCGAVKDAASRALGSGVATLLGTDAGEEADDAPGASDGFSIAADESAADTVVADEEAADDGTPGFYKIVEPNGTVRFTSNLSEVPVEQRPKAERLAMAPSQPGAAARRAAPPRRDAKQLAAANATPPRAQPPAARARSGVHDVTLYTTSWCGWCKKTIAWLDGEGVDYVNKDVERDEAAAEEMRELTGGDSGVPVVVIDGEVIQGFDQRRMAKLLDI
jgi:glutaredoxin